MNLALKLFKSAGVPVTAAVHRVLTEANRARDNRDWVSAAQGYQAALSRDASLAHIWVQYGHALKESDEDQAADAAYRKAIALKPDWAEPHLHLGHLRKRQGDPTGAARSYLMAVKLDPRHPDAVGELHRLVEAGSDVSAQDFLGLIDARADASLGVRGFSEIIGSAQASVAELLHAFARKDAPGAANTLAKLNTTASWLQEIADEAGAAAVDLHPILVFDVSDLIDYFRSARLPTGIQRVQIETVSNALASTQAARVRITCFAAHRDDWLELPLATFMVLCRLSLAEGDSDAPDWAAALARLRLQLAVAEPFCFPSKACLINLGTSWWLPNYFLRIRRAKAQAQDGLCYAPFVHDFIPLRTPQYCAKGLIQDFVAWTLGVFDHADFFFVNSEATKRDLLEVAAQLGRDVPPELIEVVRLDADPRRPAAAKTVPDAWGRGPYVLLVSTFEARKQHGLAFDAWLELIHRHGLHKIPKLVCIGKRGWLDDAIYAKLDAHDALRDRVVMVSGLADPELAEAYRGCLFTLYPSAYEGWGLPVTESLCFGKTPLTSDSSSLPEAGGPFAVYFEAGSAPRLAQAAERLIFDQTYRKALEAKIADAFRPRAWSDIADQVIDAASRIGPAASEASSTSQKTPPARLGGYHPLMRNTETRIRPGMRTAETFRSGLGWWGQDDWGCWSKSSDARLEFSLPRRHGPLRLYLRVRGLPSHATSFQVEGGADGLVAEALDPGQLKWIGLDLPSSNQAQPIHHLHIATDRTEDLGQHTGGQDRRVIGVGVAGFFLCEADDGPTRAAFLEAVALDGLARLAFDRNPSEFLSPAAPLAEARRIAGG